MSKDPSLDPELPLFDDYPLDEAVAAKSPPATSADQRPEVNPPLAEPAAPDRHPLSLFPDPDGGETPPNDEVEAGLGQPLVAAASAAAADDPSRVSAASGRRTVLGPAALAERIYSGLLDLLVNISALAATLLLVKAMGVASPLQAWQAWTLLTAVFSYLYWVVPLAFWGQTPGMTWRHLIARNSDSEPLTFGQASRRWLGALLTVALFGAPLLLALGGRSLSDWLSASQCLTLDD